MTGASIAYSIHLEVLLIIITETKDLHRLKLSMIIADILIGFFLSVTIDLISSLKFSCMDILYSEELHSLTKLFERFIIVFARVLGWRLCRMHKRMPDSRIIIRILYRI